MRSIVLLSIILFAISCGTERHYFTKSLSDNEKKHLNDHDTLTKDFSGKTNWYRQYWTGKLRIKKQKKGYDIRQVGEWRQTSDDGTEVWTIANFDQDGHLVDQKIFGIEGMPPISETSCKKDTLSGQIRLVCESTKRYYSGGLKEKGGWIIINDKGVKEGRWEYYTESGVLEKTVEYHKDKIVR